MAFIFGSLLAANGTGESDNLTPPVRSPPYDTYEGVAIDVRSRVGTSATWAPDAPPAYAADGLVARSSFHDWYYRIHFYPSDFALGNLTGSQQHLLTMWNAYFAPVQLQSVALVNGFGISIGQPTTPPASVGPLARLVYTVEISQEGPPIIDAEIQFVVDAIQYDIPISGRRVMVFPFRPHWASPVEETLEHLTVLEVTYTGKEQVSELRVKPRRILQYNLRIHNDDVNLFDNLVYGWGGRLFSVPLWMEKTKLQSDAVAGALSLEVDSTFARSFRAGGTALLFKDSRENEVVEIEAVNGQTITLNRETTAAWPAGTLVIPLMVGALEANVPTTRITDTHVDAIVRFTSNPEDNYPRTEIVAASATYRGDELYLGETNWISPLAVTLETRERRAEGDGAGVFRLTRRAPFPLITRGFRWMAKDEAATESLRQFFARRRGRLKPVWMPSGTRDFALAEPANSAESTIYVRNTDYGGLVGMQAARRDIVILLRDGSYICRRITAYSIDHRGYGAITLDAALGVDISPQTVKKISYLGLYRLGSDSITFSWVTDASAVVETQLTLKESFA